MDTVKRMLDANINRASEGLRVLEDVARFSLANESLSENFKSIRHSVRKNIMKSIPNLLENRDSLSDIGPDVSKKLNVEGKKNLVELVEANFKRSEEALRSIEESLKVLGFQELSKVAEGSRYQLYTLEKDLWLIFKRCDKRSKLNTDIYCLTAEEHSGGRDNIEVVKRMLNAGVKLIQYREKDKSMLDKYRQCVKLRELTHDAGATLIINDHIDLAMSVGADGVHLGQDDIPLKAARQIAGETMIIGVSTHSPSQARKAVEDGADYIGVGPIYKTFTKKDVCAPVGLEYLDYAVNAIDIPFVAIGGIKLHNLNQVKARGAKLVALVTEIVGAEDIEATIETIRNL